MERKCANCGNAAWCDGKSPITDICIQCRYVDVNGHPEPSNWKPQTMTNADHIRNMSDKELANFLADKYLMESLLRLKDQEYEPTATQIETIKHALYCTWMNWLQQPAEEE